MKKYDKEFFIVYKKNPVEFYDSAIGIDNLAYICKKTRKNMLKSLKKDYILIDKTKYIILRESDFRTNWNKVR